VGYPTACPNCLSKSTILSLNLSPAVLARRRDGQAPTARCPQWARAIPVPGVELVAAYQPLSFVAAALHRILREAVRRGEKEGSRQARRRPDRLACGPRYSAGGCHIELSPRMKS